MPTFFRETRPDEIGDAVEFVAVGGEALDADTVRHDLSHTAQRNGVVVGSAVMCLDADAQHAVIVHVGDDGATDDQNDPADDDSSSSKPGGSDETDANDTADSQASSADPDSPPEDLAVVGRHLLDLTLMKLRNDGECTTRVRASPGLAERLWAEAGWLDGLPDLTPGPDDASWIDRLASGRLDAVEVVRRAWDKAAQALAAVRDEVDGVAGARRRPRTLPRLTTTPATMKPVPHRRRNPRPDREPSLRIVRRVVCTPQPGGRSIRCAG